MGYEYSQFIDVLFVSIIVYRISTDMAEMDGPFNIFARIRGAALYNPKIPNWVYEGLNCGICISFWVACTIVLYTFDWRYFVAAGITRLLIEWRNRK